MKQKTYITALVSGLCLLLTTFGCQKNFFDQVPDDRITIEEVFNRRLESEQYLANIYARIREENNQWSENPWMGVADEADMTWARSGYNTYFINLGAWDPNSGYFQFWEHYYRGIRSATYFMQHIGGNAEILKLPNGQALIDQYWAEARFLRAYFYFCLLRQYGPVILLGDEVIPPDTPFDNLLIPRNTFDECVSYIASELDAAGQALPLAQTNAREEGRATRSMAMAVKARLLLYAASPLYNGNTDYASFTNEGGTPLISQSYDENKWKLAADAAKAIIDLNHFDLYKVTDSEGNIEPIASYSGVVLEPWNREQIFVRPAWNDGDWERHASPRFGGGWSGIGATQKQVDAYFMANGKAIDEEGSGYVETGFSTADTRYTTAGTYNMYVNREPRFYASIVYNGSYWIHRDEGDIRVGMHRYGNTGMEGTWDFSRTGYLIRKNIHPNSNPRLNRFVRRPYVMFRLGEVYLNYAEALNEYDPGNPDILRYINLIRERAGIPKLEGEYTQEEMRQRIQQERQVELAFENHRYFDTRRWKIAMETDGGPFEGMNVEAPVSDFDDPEFYRRTVFETRVFQERHYLWPIPQSEIDRNRALIQNPGW
ncbi:RagB/SusD family nutrient uptake outer membrane protein [Parapedobacter sp. ISTM3]|uniref:RagB/SusD family nutrient uptake outer membrane protein n=1 Tax=Parapedobacter sp. ISTM3 TaxID=2800130 RepID=UPI001905954E|nr:RagB/SusD family nutrient uptake outer membrane protein [Parapedobacter sp. ISTM3]MBK1439351.1 RagB/SusD family nutrient uptake outer membrane protein [Parapedobacter sp. ISTM3]